MKIILDDITDARVLALLQIHLDGMHQNTPAEHVHALDVSNLQSPDVSFWTIWEGKKVLGCGALKELSDKTAEIKSMRTHPVHLRKGAAAAILEHILDIAKHRSYLKVSLETGDGEAFEPALNLYRRYGFKNGAAFGSYEANAYSQFLHLELG